MVRLPWRAAGAALAAVALTLGACGGPSEEEKREARATFVRDADAVCDTLIDGLSAGSAPRTYGALAARMQRDQQTWRTAAKDLHDLRESLGDSATQAIIAFDERLAAVPAATGRIVDAAELADGPGARRSSGALRAAYDGVYDAAQAAKLRRCGRGGNRAADLALFTVYRDQIVTANAEVILRLDQRQDARDFATYRRFLRSGLRPYATYRKRLARLAPPKVLRRSHRLLLTRTTRTLQTGRRVVKLLDRGQVAAINGGARLMVVRLVRQARLADVAADKIRRILRLRAGRRERVAPGGTNAA